MKKTHHKSDQMSDLSFRFMNAAFVIVDAIYPHIDKRIPNFGIRKGMIVVDYGCGPGRYTVRFSKIVGEIGKIYAVDVHELAIQVIRIRSRKNNSQTSKLYWQMATIQAYPMVSLMLFTLLICFSAFMIPLLS